MLCGGSIGLQADTVTLASERSIALQGNTVPQVRGNAPQIPCFTMPLEFPAPPSLQILAIARYRCGLRLVWHENPSLLYVPSRMKHYTSTMVHPADRCATKDSAMHSATKQFRWQRQSGLSRWPVWPQSSAS